MTNPRTILAALVIACAPLVSVTATAEAAPTPHCANRGEHHWERHGGIEDDRFHMSRYEPLSCHPDKASGDEKDDKDLPRREDDSSRERSDNHVSRPHVNVSRPHHRDRDRDDKSWLCRRVWWC